MGRTFLGRRYLSFKGGKVVGVLINKNIYVGKIGWFQRLSPLHSSNSVSPQYLAPPL